MRNKVFTICLSIVFLLATQLLPVERSCNELINESEKLWLALDYDGSNRALEKAKNICPDRAEIYWRVARNEYGYLEMIPRCGYEVIGQFPLPEEWWWNDYYGPLEQRIHQLRAKYGGRTDALRILDAQQREVDLYKKHQKWYGSAFLVMGRK